MDNSVRWMETLLLGWAVWPAIRLLTHGRLLRIFPEVYAAVAVCLALWMAAIAGLAICFTPGLHPLALVTAVAWPLAAWRARPGYGKRHGIPPGSLSFTASLKAIADRRFYLNEAACQGPIFKMSQFHRPTICVLGLDRGHRLLRRHADALALSPQPFTSQVSGGFLRYMDEDTYQKYGSLFRHALSRPVIEAAALVTTVAIRRELGRMANDCSIAPSKSVPPTPYLLRMVNDSFRRALFGIVPGSELGRIMDLPYRAFCRQKYTRKLSARTKASLAELRRLLQEHSEHLRKLQDRGQAPVCALTEIQRLQPSLPDLTCLDNLLFISSIPSHDVMGLLRWLLVYLGRHPEWMARRRSEPAAPVPGDHPDLTDRILQETLRLAQSEYLYRVMKQDVEFEGFLLPKGWRLRLCVWESHRDPDVFENPERFNPDRFLPKKFTKSEYSPFGGQAHACNGVSLINLIGRTLIEELAQGFAWSTEGDGEPERDYRHWSHWRPGSGFRVNLRRAASSARTSPAESEDEAPPSAPLEHSVPELTPTTIHDE